MKRAAHVFVLSISFISSTAFAAEPTPEEVDRARTFFNAGAQAYGSAKYADAMRAFEQAYVLTPRPPVLFSLAQAERKEFLEHGDAHVLRRAIAHYKEYLEKVPTGGRRSETIEAKADLESRLARLDPSQANASASSTPQDKRKPRVTVYSATPNAHASIDNGPPQELPYFADIEPGKHRVRVFADGYFDAEQDVSGDRGVDVPVNLPLRDKPALVTVTLNSNAEVFVDGRLVANTPLNRPIEVAPGPHVIAIAKNGKHAWSQEVVLERAKPFTVEPKLVTSGQRYIAYSMLGTGIVSLALGGVFALAAGGNEGRAKELERKGTKENLSTDELAEHNRALDRRDNQRTGAIIFASVGAAITAGGLVFYFFDNPPIALLPPRSVEPTPKPQTPLDVSATLRREFRPYPLLGAGVYGAGFTTRF